MHTELAELAISEEQVAEGPQTLQSLLAIALGLVLLKRSVGALDALVVITLGLPE